MKIMKRIIAFTLFLCMVISLLPSIQFKARAAEVMTRYELDTDGIDPGANYLIVNTGTAGTANGLLFYYGNSNNTRTFRGQSVQVQTDENGVRYIDSGFTNEADCLFQFSAAQSGKITHGTYAIDLTTGRYTTSTNPQTLTFTSAGGGAYRIHYSTSSWFYTTTYYLRYNSSSWTRSSTNSTVYLYKQVEYEVGYNVRFDGNGYTSGQLPADAEKLDKGTQYTIPAAPVALRKDVGLDTWLFLCWNTKPDGSGVEYAPGDKITITEDLTLYADWHQQVKHTVTMATELNGVRTDVDKISGQNKTFAVKKDGDGTYIPLERTADGTYITKVVENGDYIVYSRVDNGEYEPVHGHMVTIYNQDGTTVCQHFTVSYQTQGGVWAEGQDPGSTMCHALDTVTLTENVPTSAGNYFLGWQDQDGKEYAPGDSIQNVQKEIVLTALWAHTIDITVQITIDHRDGNDGQNNAADRDEALLQLLREENGANLPLDQVLLDKSHVSYNPGTNTTTYTVQLKDQPQGIYHATCVKPGYETHITHTGAADENQLIVLNLRYAPENFDLTFDVQVNTDSEAEKELMPKAVNVKVTYWGLDKNGVLGWHIITQQDGHAPTTVAIDENGMGSGFFPVWKNWSGTEQAYEYRVVVTSFVMPDGTIVPASGNGTLYTADGSGLYQATVSVGPDGRVPAGNQTEFSGAYFDGNAQAGDIKVVVEITPFTVTLDAGEGKLDGQQTVTLENQYRYPDLSSYIPTPTDETKVFLGWFDKDGNRAETLAGGYLTENVTYTARYSDNITLTGEVQVATTYQQDGQTVNIIDVDLPTEVVVLVRKQIGEHFITLASQRVPVTYTEGKAVGSGEYQFEKLPNDGTHYQISVLSVNYDSAYDNNLDETFSPDEDIVIVDAENATAKANAFLSFNPEQYRLGLQVDTSKIAEGFRPTSVLAQIMYRDLGNILPFHVISQHTVAPYGVQISLDKQGQGIGADDVWIRHVDGTYYEYQIALSKLYGSVAGAYLPGGTEFTADSPFTVEYSTPSNYQNQDADGNGAVKATLVPKEYSVILDLNLGDDKTPVQGMDAFMVDDKNSDATYAYIHTWSYSDDFEAYPYRDGYVFMGWKENAEEAEDKELVIENGVIHVGATMAKTVTLTAQWEKLSDTDYTVRHLELNTNKVLRGAQAVRGVAAGSEVVAADAALSIPGYDYAGALVGGVFMHKAENPAMTVSTETEENLLVIYYLPDSSSGYTEQVQSNLTLDKTAVLENDGTYTINLETYTMDNPVTTKIRYDTPLDVVLVLDQSGSMYQNGVLDDLQEAVGNFITLLANHGRENEADHRVAIVGYASDEEGNYSSPNFPTAGSDGSKWYNTGVFGVHGDFHPYSVTGFNYTEYTGSVSADGVYYTKANDTYVLLTYHQEYRHLITKEEARLAVLENTPVYGYVDGQYVALTRNSSGLWLYGDKKLYTSDDFFTYHTNVWTHREGLERREIHAYGVGDAFREVGDHHGVYTRSATKDANPQKSLYQEALIPISLGAGGSGGVTPGLITATQNLGSNGLTYVSYGMEMANNIFAANPLEEGSDRKRIVIVFTDGNPGDGRNFNEDEANRAMAYAQIASDKENGYGADIYTVGLYGNDVVAAESDQVFFMNGLSSNYPDAKNLDDVWVSTSYRQAPSGYRLNLGGPYYVNENGTYYELSLISKYSNRVYYNCWGYTNSSGTRVNIVEKPVAEGHPTVIDGMVEGWTIYKKWGDGYQSTPYSGFYSEAKDAVELRKYFTDVVQEITTNITTEIVLHGDTILRDIMGQGLVLTPDTVITAYKVEGGYNATTKKIDWRENTKQQVAQISLAGVTEAKVSSEETTDITFTNEDGSVTTRENVPFISVYNYDPSVSVTDPNAPHTIDITGYDFENNYIKDGHDGYKMVVEITSVEARDDVQWGRSTATNHERSGLWLPMDENQNRQLLMAFDQPSTIFVERAYVLDYGKEFVLSDWYFDDGAEEGQKASAIHLDLEIADGMNGFDENNPNLQNAKNGAYGNTEYGNVRLENGEVIYSPTTMNWGGYDSFYVFGNTWRKTVLAQDANQNGNLWNKVTVIPANNIYYEDSFITKESTTQNGIEGFTFTDGWSTVGQDSGNTEIPEHLESAPYGDVHGWTDSLSNDVTFTDGSAHFVSTPGQSAQLTFTGTGVEVYTHTNKNSGMVVAVLKSKTVDADGKETLTQYKSLAIDNLSVSGENGYYHIPTVAFKDLPYGTYTLQLIATVATGESGLRSQYYIDGVRIHNPLGNTTNFQGSEIKDAYGLEVNAVFTEVRDILIDRNNGFDADQQGFGGAVFIDQIKPGQGTENDQTGTGVATYEIGTFRDYGPKNEVYLSAGQAIVLKVEEGNTYYVGLKSLSGGKVTANVSGVDQVLAPVAISIEHTTDMYYRVNPVDGYIVIQNGNTEGDGILSITNLRTTNVNGPVANGGVVAVAPQAAVAVMENFTQQILDLSSAPIPEPEQPEEPGKSPAQIQIEQTLAFAREMFSSVQQWLEKN